MSLIFHLKAFDNIGFAFRFVSLLRCSDSFSDKLESCKVKFVFIAIEEHFERRKSFINEIGELAFTLVCLLMTAIKQLSTCFKVLE